MAPMAPSDDAVPGSVAVDFNPSAGIVEGAKGDATEDKGIKDAKGANAEDTGADGRPCAILGMQDDVLCHMVGRLD
jgi:hypothetical protein